MVNFDMISALAQYDGEGKLRGETVITTPLVSLPAGTHPTAEIDTGILTRFARRLCTSCSETKLSCEPESSRARTVHDRPA